MNEWARVFAKQIAAGAGGAGVALIAATNGTFSVSKYGAVASRKEFGEAKIEKGSVNEYEE